MKSQDPELDTVNDKEVKAIPEQILIFHEHVTYVFLHCGAPEEVINCGL